MLTETTLGRVGVDAVALKPAEHDLENALDLDVASVVVDYEGREHVPDEDVLSSLADAYDLLVTTPVRADGFDPLGDTSLVEALPADANRVLVAGNAAYLTEREAGRAIAPRIRAALEASPDAWVGTEGIERVALAAGGTQFELLSPGTAREIRAMRAAGFGGDVALYAPTVLSGDDDEVLDAVGEYVARRGPVRDTIPDTAATDSNATGNVREVLLQSAEDYALVGDADAVRERVETLEDHGIDRVVAYPANGVSGFRE